MTTIASPSTEPNAKFNGLNVTDITNLAARIQQHQDYGQFQFRARNQWIDGALTRSFIQNFYAGGKENTARTRALVLDSDQPHFLGGSSTAANPVEQILHALGSCLTTTLVYHASVAGIDVDSVDTNSIGHLDARGFFGISNEVSKGYKKISVAMKVKSKASVETLREMALHSPVYDMLSKALEVELNISTQ